MQAIPSDITDLERVGAALDAALPAELRPATVLACRTNGYTATFASQVIDCELGNGQRVTLLCKHGSTHPVNPDIAYGGVGYEAGIYRDLLDPAGLSPVRCFGWWTDPATGRHYAGTEHFPFIVATKLMLIVSEISEAMEGHRKGLPDDKLPHRSMIEVELADAVHRIADLAGALGCDLGGALVEKMAFNRIRADHKPGARMMAGGKAY